MKNNRIKTLVSVSGGRTSVLMAKDLKENYSHLYEMVFIYANAGQEDDRSLEFMNQADKEFQLNCVWVEAVVWVGKFINGKRHVFEINQWKRISKRLVDPNRYKTFDVGTTHRKVTFETAARKDKKGRNPFSDVIAKYGIPNVGFPHCSRELKRRPIHDYVNSALGWKNNYLTAIGFRIDEPKRIDRDVQIMERQYYHFVDVAPMTKQAVIDFWKSMPFDLQIKEHEGNCTWCIKKTIPKLMFLCHEGKTSDWIEEMESKYQHYTPPTRTEANPPYAFFRGNHNIEKIREKAVKYYSEMETQTAIEISSEILRTNGYGDLFNDCSESCEAS